MVLSFEVVKGNTCPGMGNLAFPIGKIRRNAFGRKLGRPCGRSRNLLDGPDPSGQVHARDEDRSVPVLLIADSVVGLTVVAGLDAGERGWWQVTTATPVVLDFSRTVSRVKVLQTRCLRVADAVWRPQGHWRKGCAAHGQQRHMQSEPDDACCRWHRSAVWRTG